MPRPQIQSPDDPLQVMSSGANPAATHIGIDPRPGHPRIVAVIPAYRVQDQLESVLRSIPAVVSAIVVVDDASEDATATVAAGCAADDPRILVERHDRNQGVGGAVVTGFRRALAIGCDIAVKIDGDGQMSLEDLPRLLQPLLNGEADYAKGNRFRDFAALSRMPALRRAGNMALSFLVKAATGYWHCFDPTNGYVAIRAEVLAKLPLNRVSRSYFFEISMLSELNLLGAVVQDVAMPARYGAEVSNMSLQRIIREFPLGLLRVLGRRIILKHFLYDFNLVSMHLLAAVPLLTTGIIFGGYNWIYYVSVDRPAPTGTVVISALLIILGFQLLLAAVAYDVQLVPRAPLSKDLRRAGTDTRTGP